MAYAAIYYPAYLKTVLSNKGEWFQVSQIYFLLEDTIRSSILLICLIA